MMKSIKKSVCLAAVLVTIIFTGIAKAEVYTGTTTHTVEASLQGMVKQSGAVSMGGSEHDVAVGYLWAADETRSWIKFDIPKYPNERIARILLNIDVYQSCNGLFGADVRCSYVQDDNWDANTIDFNSPTNDYGIEVKNRNSTDTGETGLISSDITSWLTVLPGEGQGQTLSIRLHRTAGGNRCAVIRPATLTITTELDLDRGHRIIMENELQIQAQVFWYEASHPAWNLDMNKWAQSNFSTVNLQWGVTGGPAKLGSAPGLPWGMWNSYNPYDPNYLPSLVSMQYQDEQDISNPTTLADVTNALASMKTAFPDVLCFTNQEGSAYTLSELLAYIKAAKPDMLMMDTYPWSTATPPAGGSPADFYTDLQKQRIAALTVNDPNNPGKTPIPYALYLDVYREPAAGNRVPSESEFRLNQFSAWSFGYTFASAFVYDTPNPDANSAALFDGWGDANSTAAFGQMAETNRQSRNLGPTLIRLLSTDVRFVPGQHMDGTAVDNNLPVDVNVWDASADPNITGISAVNLGAKNDGLAGDVIVGYFQPLHESFDSNGYENEIYFMITNGLSDPNGTAAQTRQRITINFDFGASAINSLLRLSRNTGEVETVALIPDGGSTYHLELDLDGGTGDLFKFDDGAPFIVPQCAQLGTAYLPEDMSGPDGVSDCYVNSYDFAVFAAQWLTCSEPNELGCDQYWRQ